VLLALPTAGGLVYTLSLGILLASLAGTGVLEQGSG
jgi:predicted membrane-bound spermidine synthase